MTISYKEHFVRKNCFILSLILANAIYSQSNPNSEKKPHPELAADDSFSTGHMQPDCSLLFQCMKKCIKENCIN